MPGHLQIAVRFPHGYGGGELGAAEDVPSHARLHEALVAAAAGGPWASIHGRVLVVSDAHRHALRWLEDHEPVGIVVPGVRREPADVARYRWRASPVNPNRSSYEAASAHDGPVAYRWPAAPPAVVDALRQIAPEVSHVGRADSVALVRVWCGAAHDPPGTLHERRAGRGPGRVLRVPGSGRLTALEAAHRDASRTGSHGVGPLNKQAADQIVTGANLDCTALRRFVIPGDETPWPYRSVWQLNLGSEGTSLLVPSNTVRAAVAVHRALVRAIGTDVPAFVTGRADDGPLRGSGHLAIQLVPTDDGPRAVVAIPDDVAAADESVLLEALRRRLRCRPQALRPFDIRDPQSVSATAYWDSDSELFATRTPLVLDAPGHPRRGPWSLGDAVVCSVGYALRGVLERRGVEWGTGWGFRRDLVRLLRDDYGVDAEAQRVHRHASRYAHRAREGDLLIAVNAAVSLGRLASPRGGFLAIGRSRHLGGGLLQPVGTGSDG